MPTSTVEPEFYNPHVLRPPAVYDHFFWHGWFIVKWFVDLQVDHLPNATNDLFLASQNKILTCYEQPFQLKTDEMWERNVCYFNGGWAKLRFKRWTVDTFNWVEFNLLTLAQRLKRTFD